MSRALVIGLGGFVGTLARYGISGLLLPWAPPGIPWGTMLVNISGSFAIGLVIAAAVERNWMQPDLRLILATGVCGGYTTMSSFSFETLAMLEQGSVGLALAYMALTIVACIAATWLGVALIRLM